MCNGNKFELFSFVVCEFWSRIALLYNFTGSFTHVLFVFQAQKIADECDMQPTLGDFVRAAMGIVMTNSLAEEFNWWGKNRKVAFQSQEFAKLLSCELTFPSSYSPS